MISKGPKLGNASGGRGLSFGQSPSWLVAALPAIFLVFLLMLPRLISPQFGFLDDVNTLRESEAFVLGEWEPSSESGSGRFRPVYWLYYAVIYGIAGENPRVFFAGNALMLAWITVATVWLAYLLTGSKWEAGLAGAFFVASGPIIENAFTLSKGELLQTCWILLSLLIISRIPRANQRWKRFVVVALAAAALLGATASKETAMAIVPIALGWLFLSMVLKDGGGALEQATQLQVKQHYAAAAVLGNFAYLVWRGSVMPIGLGENSYASNYLLSPVRMADSARNWLVWLNRDFLFLAPLILIALLLLIQRKKFARILLVGDALIWMVGWLALFLPWHHQLEYYLLPFAIGSSVLGASLTVHGIRALRERNGNLRGFIGAALAGALILFASTIPSNVGNAKLQLVMDSVNSELQRYIADNIPMSSELLINIHRRYQYVREIPTILIELEGRDDLAYDVYGNKSVNPSPRQRIYVLAPIMENQFNPSVRLGFPEHLAKQWNSLMLSEMEGRIEKIKQFRGSFRSSSVDVIRLFCPVARFMAYCDVPNTPFDLRTSSYGWDLYEVKGPE